MPSASVLPPSLYEVLPLGQISGETNPLQAKRGRGSRERPLYYGLRSLGAHITWRYLKGSQNSPRRDKTGRDPEKALRGL